jgi:hypothetical protein
VSRQRYLVDSAVVTDDRTIPERRAMASQFSVLLRQVRALGNNVNQLAMVANSTSGVPAGTSEALEAIARLESQLAEAIEGLK